MTPIPTPYDITDVPYIPWDPPLSFWIALVAAFLLALLYFMGLTRSPKRAASNLEQTFLKHLRDIEAEATEGNIFLASTKLASLIRGYLSLIINPKIQSMTAREFLDLSCKKEFLFLSPVAVALSELENSLYAKAPDCRIHFDRLVSLANELIKSRSTR